MVWGVGNKNSSNIKALSLMASTLVRNVEKQLNVKKNSIGLLKNRSSRGSCFIDPDDMEFKDTMKNARSKLESSMDSQPCLVRVRTLGTRNPVAKTSPTLTDQNTDVSWKPTNLRDSALERLNKKIVKIALLGMGSIR